MARLIKQDRGNYTNTSNLVVRDDRLHWNSRGVFNYLWSQANEWQFYVREIAQHSPGGEDELRTCLNELEKYGYLKRTPRHREDGKFGGMDWILSDTGGLNRHQENTDDGVNRKNLPKKQEKPDDGVNAQNQPKKEDQPLSGSTVGRIDRRTDNPTLRNNNNKKYQYKEISTERNSLSNETDQEIKDPFYQPPVTKSEREKQIDNLIYKFVANTRTSVDSNMVQQIRNVIVRIPFDSAESCVNQTIQAMSTGGIQNPPAYLISLLKNARE